MLIYAILLLLLLIAVTLRRDMTILFSRITIIISLYCLIIALSSLYLRYLDKGIGLYGGLFHSTSNTQIFQIFIFISSTIILQLTGFYPNKILIKEHCSLNKIILYRYNYSAKKLKIGQEDYMVMVYTLIILCILIVGLSYCIYTCGINSEFIIKSFTIFFFINILYSKLKNKFFLYSLFLFKFIKNIGLEKFSLLIYYNLININIINYLLLGVTILIFTLLADVWFVQALLCLTSIMCIYYCVLSIIYINYINKEFKNKYPILYYIISFICLIIIVLSLIILYKLIFTMLYDIKNYILNMNSANNQPQGSSNPYGSNGNQQGNRPGRGPSHNTYNTSSANDDEEEKKKVYEENKQQFNEWKRQQEEVDRQNEIKNQQYIEWQRDQYRRTVWENANPYRMMEIWHHYETSVPQGKGTFAEWQEFYRMRERYLKRQIKIEAEKCNIPWL